MRSIESIYHSHCRTRFPRPTNQEVSALERRLKLRLPKDFRKYLKTYNGGVFSEPLIVFPEPLTVKWRDGMVTHTEVGLEAMNGIHATHSVFELGRVSDLLLFDNNDPIQLLIIGHTQTGSLLLLDLIEENEGEILIKFPDEYAYKIADGIEEFFDLIKE